MRPPVTNVSYTNPVVVTSDSTESQKEATFAGTFASTLESTYELITNGAAAWGFHLKPATNSTVRFEGSFDGDRWSDVTLRQMGSHGYATNTAEEEDWIGSCSTLKYVRFCTHVAGTGSHIIHGRFTRNPSTLEGIEHGNQPHRIGSTVTAKPINLSTGCSNLPLWTPTTGHRLVISDIHFTVTDNNGVVTLTDGSLANAAFIFHGHFKPPSGESVFVPVSFSLPHVFAAANSALRITVVGNPTIQGVVHGYETE